MSYIVMKQKILFIMHMPPPVHGAAMVGQYIYDSKLINEKFEGHYINLTTAKNLQDIGKVGIRKLVDFYALLRKIRKSLKTINPDDADQMLEDNKKEAIKKYEFYEKFSNE